MYAGYLEKKLTTIALMLGVTATVVSLVIALSAIRKTSTKIEDQFERFYLTRAKYLAAIASLGDNISDSVRLDQIKRAWDLETDRAPDEYFSVIDDSSKILFCSAGHQTVGSLTKPDLLVDDPVGNRLTLEDLIRLDRQFAGGYISSSGKEQIAAFIPIPDRGWLVGVHRSKQAIKAKITDELRAQFWGMLAISLGIIPLTLGFLYISFMRINRAHHKTERDLLESVKALEPVLQYAVDPIYRYNLIHSRYEYFSPSCINTHGYSAEEMINKGIETSQIHPDDLLTFQAHVNDLQQAESVNQNFQQILEYRFKHKTRGYRWLSDSRSLLTDSLGNPIAIVGSIRDVTEHKLAEVSLKRSEEINRSITQSAPNAIITIDMDGAVLSWNKAAEVMFGYQADEMIDQQLSLIIPARLEAEHHAGLNSLKKGDESMLFRKIIKRSALRKDGSEFNVEFSLSHWKSENKSYHTAIIRDVTSREVAEAKLFKALEDARQANDVKDQFIANISHEIRTPLTSITGFLNLIQSSQEQNPNPEIQQFFKYINHSTDRLLRTVDSILNLSQLKAGKVKLLPRDLHLADFSRQICEELQLEAEIKGLTLEFQSTVEQDLINLDEVSMYQAISNIVHNAIKYTQTGGIQVKLDRIRGQMVLVVSDTGIGMTQDYLQRMFQPFSQESEGFTKDFQGIGLGLALTKQYLELNQVELTVESQKDKGSSFTLLFPGNRKKQDVG